MSKHSAMNKKRMLK